MKRFNTAGPCRPDRNYMVDPIARTPEALPPIERGDYFVLHAPRQTGKTTLLMALARSLTASGRYAAAYMSCEEAEPFGDDVERVEPVILDAIRHRADRDLPVELRPPAWPDSPPGRSIRTALTAWAESCPRPIVLFLDEIDAVRGESLRSVLRQIRAGFPNRPREFPHSVVLCGLRDVRDYKAASGGDPTRLGTASPFNIKVVSMRLGDFSEEEVRSLLAQHTTETGQRFEEGAIERVWRYAAGQPWLTNALVREVIEEMQIGPPEPITAEHIDEAKERLVLARQTHLDSLVSRLMEPRVRRVLGPLLAGETFGEETFADDVLYVRDLGLVALSRPLRVANPIYREVIVRVLAAAPEDQVLSDPRSFVLPGGGLDMRRLLEEFVVFWRANGETISTKMPYHEVAPQLVLMGFLHRIVNGGGLIDREYGVGRGRIDLLVRWPIPPLGTPAPPGGRTWQREALELKVWADGRPDPLEDGLAQLDRYLDSLSLPSGWLVLFDRRTTRPEAASAGPPPDLLATGLLAAGPSAVDPFATARTPSGREAIVLRL